LSDPRLPRSRWTLRRIGVGVLLRGPSALLDCLVVAAIYLFAAGVRTGGRLDAPSPGETAALAVVAGLLQVAANVAFDIYWRDWSIAGLEDLIALIKATLIAFLVLLGIDSVVEPHVIPYAALFSGVPVVLLAQSALKLRPRWPQIFQVAVGRRPKGENVVIVGAGRTGQLLARDLLQHGFGDYRVAGFLDDELGRWGTYVRGIRVLGGVAMLPELISSEGISLVVIAMAQPTGDVVRRVVRACEGVEVRIRAVRGVSIAGSDSASLRPLGIGELLERSTVDLDTVEAQSFVRGKRVLITGAAGSIGAELARQVARLGPARLILLDLDESGLHDLMQELGIGVYGAAMRLVDIRNSVKVGRIFETDRPEVVFHAAAYKHVPILETAIDEAITVNALGTAYVLAASQRAGCEHFVFISSDKAVQPTNVLGLTKRFGELLTMSYASIDARRYCVVRFGNVLGSVGSVVPIFERQIDGGGPVTITHPEATRYFMTIPEAAGLVIEAGAIAEPGDLLVLDMGTPMSILDLAKKMIRLRGLRTPGDIEIAYTGLREGERLREELFFPYEVATGSQHNRVLRAETPGSLPSLRQMTAAIAILEQVVHVDELAALEVVRRTIAGTPAVDLVAVPHLASERAGHTQ
jgi:FlaA1/EpsC-like NDP-sugar epimerase